MTLPFPEKFITTIDLSIAILLTSQPKKPLKYVVTEISWCNLLSQASTLPASTSSTKPEPKPDSANLPNHVPSQLKNRRLFLKRQLFLYFLLTQSNLYRLRHLQTHYRLYYNLLPTSKTSIAPGKICNNKQSPTPRLASTSSRIGFITHHDESLYMYLTPCICYLSLHTL